MAWHAVGRTGKLFAARDQGSVVGRSLRMGRDASEQQRRSKNRRPRNPIRRTNHRLAPTLAKLGRGLRCRAPKLKRSRDFRLPNRRIDICYYVTTFSAMPFEWD